MSRDAIVLVPDEFQAVDRAMAEVQSGDLIMVLADKVEAVLTHVQRYTPAH